MIKNAKLHRLGGLDLVCGPPIESPCLLYASRSKSITLEALVFQVGYHPHKEKRLHYVHAYIVQNKGYTNLNFVGCVALEPLQNCLKHCVA